MTRTDRALLIALGASLVLAVPAAAGPLGPRKASELVTLVPSETCDGGEGFLYGRRVLPDGSFADFTVPPKRVLVVTGWSFVFTGATPAISSAVASLQIDPSVVPLASAYFSFDADGTGGGSAPVHGVVAAGETLCGRHSSGLASVAPFSGVVQGYLAKDR